MGCRPQERKIWKAMIADMRGPAWEAPRKLLSNVERFLNQYVDIAEGKATDTAVQRTFNQVEGMILGAINKNIKGHQMEISIGKRAYQEALDKGCNIDEIVDVERKVSRCHVSKCPDRGEAPWLKKQWKAIVDSGCRTQTTDEEKRRCVEMGMNSDRIDNYSRKIGLLNACEKTGCSPGRMLYYEKAEKGKACFGDSNVKLGSLLHYAIDRNLRQIYAEAGVAATRQDKVLLIDRFVQMVHHSGSVLPDVEEEAGRPLLDVLDCLAGVDQEQLAP